MVMRTSVSAPLTTRALALRQALETLERSAERLNEIGATIAHRLHLGGTVLTIGNGGGAGLAQHLSAELTGRLSPQRQRGPLAASTLAADVATLTALSNDYGYAAVFARQLAARARPNDVLVVFTTSGQSDNLLAADEVAARMGMYRVALLGRRHSPLEACDGVLRVDALDPGTVQECHLLLLHALTEVVEEAYATAACCLDRSNGGQTWT